MMTERFDEKERLSDIPLEDLEKEAEKIALLEVMKKVAEKKILKDLRMKELAERKKKAGKILRRFKCPLLALVCVILLCYCIHSAVDAQERHRWAQAWKERWSERKKWCRHKLKEAERVEELKRLAIYLLIVYGY